MPFHVSHPANFAIPRNDRRFHWNDKVSRVRKARYVNPPLVPAAAHFEC
jgi:hypothetical protein